MLCLWITPISSILCWKSSCSTCDSQPRNRELRCASVFGNTCGLSRTCPDKALRLLFPWRDGRDDDLEPQEKRESGKRKIELRCGVVTYRFDAQADEAEQSREGSNNDKDRPRAK